jgi:hypothetical protein
MASLGAESSAALVTTDPHVQLLADIVAKRFSHLCEKKIFQTWLSTPIALQDYTIRTCVHNVGYAVAKAVANICQPRLASLVLRRIVQESGDCHVFRASILQNCSRYCEKMRDIGDGRFLAHLTAVDMACVQ